MIKYAIYRITTGEFRSTITGYILDDHGDIDVRSIPIRSVQYFKTKQEAQDIINVLVQLPEHFYERDEFSNILKPTRIERCKEEYEILEIDDEAITVYPNRSNI